MALGLKRCLLKGGGLKTHSLRLHIPVRRDSLVILLSIVVDHAEDSCGVCVGGGGDADAKSPGSRN